MNTITVISNEARLILIAHNDALEHFLKRGHLGGCKSELQGSRLTEQNADLFLPAEGEGWAGKGRWVD